MADDRYGLHVATLNTTTVGGMLGYSVSGGVNAQVQGHDGIVEPLSGEVMDATPVFRFRSLDIWGVLQLLSTGYLGLTALDVWFQRYENKGEYKTGTGAAHLKAALATGCGALAVARSLRPVHKQYLVAEVDVFYLSDDGLTDPVVWSTSDTMTGDVTSVPKYTLGPAVITPSGGSATPLYTRGWDFDFGVGAEPESDSGQPYSRWVNPASVTPSAGIDVEDLGLVMSLPMSGKDATLDLYLRKMLPGGTRVPDGTAEHVKLSVKAGVSYTDEVGGEHGQKGLLPVRMQVVSDGTNPIFAVSQSAMPSMT